MLHDSPYLFVLIQLYVTATPLFPDPLCQIHVHFLKYNVKTTAFEADALGFEEVRAGIDYFTINRFQITLLPRNSTRTVLPPFLCHIIIYSLEYLYLALIECLLSILVGSLELFDGHQFPSLAALGFIYSPKAALADNVHQLVFAI